MKRIRRRIRFFGRVQGVGFRYTMYHAAQSFGVTGWVRNCYDGSVEAELEGIEPDIDSVIMAVEGARFVHIENLEDRDIPPQDSRSFEITD